MLLNVPVLVFSILYVTDSINCPIHNLNAVRNLNVQFWRRLCLCVCVSVCVFDFLHDAKNTETPNHTILCECIAKL